MSEVQTPAQPTPPPLERATVGWYAVGQYAEGVKNESFGLFLMFYYREVLGLSGSLAGLALLLSLLSDAITDPLTGRISDNWHSRWGRRHPFMVASALPVTVAYYLVFVPPSGLSQGALFAWMLGFTVLARLSMTLFHVPHLALGAELSTDYVVRTQIVGLRQFFSRVGATAPGILGLLVFMRPTERYENGQFNPGAYPPFAAVTAVLIFLPIVATCLGTRGRIEHLARPTPGANLWGHALRDTLQVLRIKNFRVHFLGSTVAFAGWGIMGTMGLHLATYFWHVSTLQLFFWGVGMYVGIFSGLSFWTNLSARMDKMPIFLWGLGIYILFTAPPVFMKVAGFWPGVDSAWYLPLYIIVLGVLAHFGIAATMVTGGSMMADIADEDELKHGERREGMFFGSVSFAAKASVGIGALIAGVVLDVVGLVPGSDPDQVPPEVVRDLGLTLGCSVILVVGASMLIFSRYDLGRARHTEIRAALDAR